LKFSDHPADEVLSLERAASITLLSQGYVGGAWLSNGQLELRYRTDLLARESSGACALPLTINGQTCPASLFVKFTAKVDVLKVVEEVRVGHPEHTIVVTCLVWRVPEGLLGFGCPLVRVIGPFTIPLGSHLCSSVGVSEVDKLLTLVISDIQDSVSMTLNDTFLVRRTVTKLVLWGTSTHQSLNFVKVAEFASEKLNIVLV